MLGLSDNCLHCCNFGDIVFYLFQVSFPKRISPHPKKNIETVQFKHARTSLYWDERALANVISQKTSQLENLSRLKL